MSLDLRRRMATVGRREQILGCASGVDVCKASTTGNAVSECDEAWNMGFSSVMERDV